MMNIMSYNMHGLEDAMKRLSLQHLINFVRSFIIIIPKNMVNDAQSIA